MVTVVYLGGMMSILCTIGMAVHREEAMRQVGQGGMVLIDELRARFVKDEFEFSKHAVDQSILRRISVHEIREAASVGELIEDYPDDKYGPSCLVLGFTTMQRPLHLHCSYPWRSLIKLITVYEPNPAEWIDHRVRR